MFMPMPTDPIKREEAKRRMSEAARRRAERPEERERLAKISQNQVKRVRKPVKQLTQEELEQKRLTAKENRRQATLRVLSDPEKKKFIDDRRREALARPETQARMSEAAKKRIRTPEFEAKRIAASQTPEAIEKNRQSKIKHFENPENRRRTSETTKAAMARPEVKAKVQAATQRQWDNPETRATIMESFQKRWERPGEREKISETTKAAMQNVLARPEFHEALSRSMQKRWSEDQDFIQRWSESMSKVHRYRGRTSIEVAVAGVLEAMGVEYEQQKRIGRYSADFYVVTQNLVIECDGDYWHSEQKAGSIERDGRKDAYLTQKGYTVLRIREKQILSGDFSSIEDALGKGG